MKIGRNREKKIWRLIKIKNEHQYHNNINRINKFIEFFYHICVHDYYRFYKLLYVLYEKIKY